uniref:VPS9 domain-containing protein n=1 Tax=Strongyloides papillosus TaxID=174720 RepID=A0A0N5BKS3_STREA
MNITDENTTFIATTEKFSPNFINPILEDIKIVLLCIIESQISTVGITAKIEDITTYYNQQFQFTTSRRLIFVTNGVNVIPVYIYGELAYHSFKVGKIISIEYAIVKYYSNCGNVLSCNRLSYITDADINHFKDLFFKSKDIKYDELKYPNLTSIPDNETIVNISKYLMHLKNTPKFPVKEQSFFFIGKIVSLGKFLKPKGFSFKSTQDQKSNKRESGPYAKILIKDFTLIMQYVTIFADMLMEIAPTISSNLERLTEDGVRLDEYLKELMNKPLIFRIKVSNFISPLRPDDPSANKLIGHIDFCSAELYYSFCQRVKSNLLAIEEQLKYD